MGWVLRGWPGRRVIVVRRAAHAAASNWFDFCCDGSLNKFVADVHIEAAEALALRDKATTDEHRVAWYRQAQQQ